jgi:L-serine dehydratase
MNMTFESLALLLETAEKNNIPLWQQISNTDRHESGLTAAEEYERMNRMWQAMKKAAQSYDRTLFSRSGLSGTEGGLFEDYVEKGATICGPFMGAVIAQAIQMGESNACMKCIVAAPTAGSCGVLPAVLIPLAATGHITEEQAVHALFIASGIGQIIANRASISGAEGGCQAEIGAAAAMAAGALVYLYNGTNDQMAAACGLPFRICSVLSVIPLPDLLKFRVLNEMSSEQSMHVPRQTWHLPDSV